MSEYAAKRHELEVELQQLNDREAEHKVELSVRYQAECRKIQTQIGSLKKKQKDLLQKYQQDKNYVHRKYRDEKLAITERMHTLRLEYLTVNEIEDK